MSKFIMGAAVTAAALAVSVPASAGVIVYTSAGGVQPAENVLFDVNQPVTTTVLGSTNQTNSLVRFTSIIPLDVNGSMGQARIEGAGGTPIDTLTIGLADPALSFTQFEFNLFRAVGTTSTVTFRFSDGTTTVALPVSGNGQNFFGFQATDGTRLTSISFDSNGAGFTDVRQVRIGGITAATGVVPEPGTWALLILGFGAIGFAMRRAAGRQTAMRTALSYA